MVNLSDYKIVLGTANTTIYEDPIAGSNGTAMIVKVNGLIEALEEEINKGIPTAKGNLLTADINNNPIQLTPGANGECLVADSTRGVGLSFEPRVDLVSDQVIQGVKDFKQNTIFSKGFIVDDISHFNHSVTIDGNFSSGSYICTESVKINDNLLVEGFTTLSGQAKVDGNLEVKGSSLLHEDLSISGGLTINQSVLARAGFTINEELTVHGDLSIGGAISIGQGLSITDNLNVGKSLVINDSLESKGNTSLKGNVDIQGGLNVNSNTIFNNSVTTKSLVVKSQSSLEGDVTINSSLSVLNGLNLNGDIQTNGALSLASNALVNGELAVGQNTSIGGNLNVKGSVKSDGHLEVNSLKVINDLDLSKSLDVGENLNIYGESTFADIVNLQSSLSVLDYISAGGSLTTNSNLEVNGQASIDKDLILGGSLTVNENITTRGTIMGGNLSVRDIAASGNISSDSELTVTGGNFETINSSQINTNDITAITLKSNNIEATENIKTDNLLVNKDLQVIGNLTSENVTGTNTGDEAPATSTKWGLVKLSNDNNEGIVYTKSDIDNNFLSSDKLGSPNGVVPLNEHGVIDAAYIVNSSDTTTNNTNLDSLSNLLSTHIDSTSNPHGLSPEDIGAINKDVIGESNGLAPLNEGGIIEDKYLPSQATQKNKFKVKFTKDDIVNSLLTIPHELNEEFISLVNIWTHENILINLMPLGLKIKALDNDNLELDFKDVDLSIIPNEVEWTIIIFR